MRDLTLADGTGEDALDAAWDRHLAELPPEEPPTEEELDAMYRDHLIARGLADAT